MLKNKLFLAIAALVFTTATIKAQTIVIDDARLNPAPNSYGAGSSVAIPLNNMGCFSINNRFKWELADASGVVIIGANAYKDSVAAFYATFLNATLPATLPAGNYSFKVTASTLGSNIATSLPFTVVANPLGITAKATPVDPNKILKDQYYYGVCDGKSLASLALYDSSTIGGIATFELIDNYRTGGGANNQTISSVGGQFALNFTPVLIFGKYRDAYYTGIAKTINGGIVSTKAYHIINSNWAISTTIAQKAPGVDHSCAGDTVKLEVLTGLTQIERVEQNFPGAIISVDWNTTPPSSSLYSQCQILAANGILTKYYAQGSCATGKSSYKVTTTVINPFNVINGPGLTGTCAAGATEDKYAFVYAKPLAKIQSDSVVCLGDTIQFKNLGNPGQGPASTSINATCSNLGRYILTLDGVTQIYASTKSETPKDTAYVFTNPTSAGYHTIKLTVNNNYLLQSPCPAHDTSKIICVDTATILPIYTIDTTGYGLGVSYFNNDSLIACSPTFKLRNGTHRTFCVDSTQFKYIWQVYDATQAGPYTDANALVVGQKFTFGPAETMNTMSPTIKINQTGKYLISLKVKGSCDTTAAVYKYVEANGDAAVTIQYDSVFNCGFNTPITINYDPAATNIGIFRNDWTTLNPIPVTKDSVHYTYQASAAATLSYKWTVTPGTNITDWEFVGGTTDTAKYPQIQFKTKGTYRVVVTFKNSCAIKTAQQIVDYQQTPSVTSISAIDTICHSVLTFNVYGFTIDTAINKNLIIDWTSNAPNGYTFTPNHQPYGYPGILTPVFSPGTTAYANAFFIDKKYSIHMNVRSKTNTSCGSNGVDRFLNIRPAIPNNNVTINICSCTPLNYQITSPANTIFKYQVLSTGGATGATSSATTYVGTITDILCLPVGKTTASTVTYTVTPKAGNCDGDPYTLTVNVQPIPTLPTVNLVYPSNPDHSMCSGEQVQIDILGTNPTDSFTWNSVTSSGNNIGNTSYTKARPSPINDLLVNTTGANDTVTYCIRIVSEFACKGDSSCETVIVTPGPPLAKITNNPGYLKVCDSNCISLSGNSPGTIGIGTWTSIYAGSPAVTFSNINDPNVQICGLNRLTYYEFAWTITPLLPGCRASADTVKFFNYDSLSTPNAGNDTVFCAVNGLIPFSTPLNGTISKAPNGYEDYTWSKLASAKGNIVPTNTLSSTFNFKDPAVDTLILTVSNGYCANKRDTVIVRAYGKPTRGSLNVSPSMPNNRYCQGSDVTFTANFDPAYSNIYRWFYVTFPSGVFVDSSAANKNPFVITNVQQSLQATAVFKSLGWDYGCKDSAFSFDFPISVDSPTLKGVIKSADSILCIPGSVATLSLTGNRGDVKGWIQSTTNATSGYGGIVAVGSSFYPNVSITTWYRAIVQSGNCPADTTAAFRVYIPSSADAAKAGNDTAICNGDTIRLIGSTPVAGNGYWKMITGVVNDSSIYPGTVANVVTFTPGNNFQTSQNPVTVNILQKGTYQFVWTINNEGCDGTADTITVKNTPDIVNNIISPIADTVCKGTNVNMTGSAATGGSGLLTYSWERSIVGSGTWTPVAFSPNSYLFSGDTTSLLRRKIKSDSCVSYSNIVQIVVHPTILNNVITAPAAICTNTPSLNVAGSVPTAGNGSYTYSWDTTNNYLNHHTNNQWYNVAANSQSYNPNVNLLDTIYFRRIVGSGKCVDTSNEVVAVVNPDAIANFTSLAPNNNTRCAPYIIGVDILNNVLQYTTYDWYIDTATQATSTFVNTGNQFAGYTIIKGLDSIKVTLIAHSTSGCKPDTMSMWFHTSATPVADFTISADSGCASNTVNVTNFSFTNTTPNKGLFTNQNWQLNSNTLTNYGNIDLPVGATFQYNPSSSGLDTTYCITLTVNSPQCGSSQKTKCIKIRTAPKVLFSATPSYQCAGSPIAFTNATKGDNLTYNWNFGDGGTSANKDTVSHIYNDTTLTSHPVKLIAMNECAKDSFTTNVVIAANTVTLNISVKGTDKYKCTPDTVTFYSNSSGGTIYVWNFGDGTISPASSNGVDSIMHIYTIPGKYTVTLSGSTTCGSVSKADTVYVYGTPKVAYTISPNTTVCKGDTVRLNNLTDTFTSHGWYYGNGTGNLDYRTYNTIGAYQIRLWAERSHTTPLGGFVYCRDTTALQTVIVKDTMSGSFTITPQGASCLPYVVLFTNTTNIPTPPINTIDWTFGEPLAQQSNAPVFHTYNALGQYNISMVIKNAGGCTYIDTTQKVIVAGPTGTWTHDTGYICGATPVNFTINGNAYTDSVIIDYGDTIVRLPYAGNHTPQHIYANGGTYYPSVTLKSVNSCTFYIGSYGAVRVDYVKAAYTIGQTNNCGNTVVTFTNKSTMDQTPALQKTSWWIDGTLGTTRDTTVTFTATNTHTVKLQTISVSGCQDTVATAIIDVKVNNIPNIITFGRKTDTACVGQTIYYEANVAPSEDPIQSYNWNFANGTTYSNGNIYANTVYGTSGNGYFDTLKVSTAYCSKTMVSARLVINPTPIVSINPSSDTSICLGNSILLTASGATNYAWSPNFGLSAVTGTSVTATPSDTVKYVVTGTNSYNCSDSASIHIGVVHPYTITINPNPNDTICKGEIVTLTAVTNSGVLPNYTWSPATGLDTIRGAVVHATPSTTTVYTVYGNNSAGCFPTTSDSVLIAVGDTLHIAFGADTVRLQGGTPYVLTPSYGNESIASYNWTPATYLDNAHVANPTATITNNVCYQVAATSIYGCKDTANICIIAFCEASQVFIPNTFTPDGNGVNDYFYVTATGITKVTSFRVFNRWGQVVFERAGFNPPPYQSATFNTNDAWDGKIKGIVAPTDTYVYTCEVTCANGTKFVYTGSVALIK